MQACAPPAFDILDPIVQTPARRELIRQARAAYQKLTRIVQALDATTTDPDVQQLAKDVSDVGQDLAALASFVMHQLYQPDRKPTNGAGPGD